MKMLKESYEKAKQLLSEHRETLDKIAAFLIERETITGKEFMQIFHEVEGTAETQPELPEKPAEEAPEKADAEPVAETGAQDVSADSNDTEEKKVQEPVNENPQESPVQE